jgi:hypothetical protein
VAELMEAQAKAMAIIGNTTLGETLLSHCNDMFSPLPKLAWKYKWTTLLEINDKMIEDEFLDKNSTRSMDETSIVTREIDAIRELDDSGTQPAQTTIVRAKRLFREF